MCFSRALESLSRRWWPGALLSVGSPLFLSGRGCIAGVWLVLTPWPRSAVREVVRAFSS